MGLAEEYRAAWLAAFDKAWATKEETKMEPNTTEMDIVQSLRWVSESAKPVDAGQMRAAADEIEVLRGDRRWIPVEERLPEDGDEVLCGVFFSQGGYMLIATYDADDKQFQLNDGRWDCPTHWMPLPEPPEVKP